MMGDHHLQIESNTTKYEFNCFFQVSNQGKRLLLFKIRYTSRSNNHARANDIKVSTSKDKFTNHPNA